jgi:hypothetical protein
MTALGVPHFAGRPSTLLRQIIVPTLGAGAVATTGLGGGGEGALAAGEHEPTARANAAANRGAAERWRMFDSGRLGDSLARSKFNITRKIC